jgi:lysophospholipase L1-like esterase
MSLIEENHKAINRFDNFAKFISWLGALLSILLLVYVYYRSEITYGGKYNDIYFKYYIISIVGIFFWIAVLRLKEKLRANIVMVGISLVVSLYLVEASLQFYQNQSQDIQFEDQRTKIEVLDDFIEKGIDSVPAVRPKDVLHLSEEILPLAGVANTTTVGENETGKWMIYPSDRYGFNNPDYEWDAEKTEYLLTGDSLTEGLAVQPGEDIAGQIRKITGQSVINLGRGGNGPLMELAEISEYAAHLQPKNVLWVYFEGNDLIGNMPRDKTSTILMNYLDKSFSQNLMSRQTEVDEILRKYIQQVRPSKYRWIRLQEIRKLMSFDDRVVDMVVDVDPIFSKILIRAKNMTEGWGGKLHFVYLPEFSRYNIVVEHDQYRKKLEVIELVRNLNIPVIDIHQEVFYNHTDILSLFPFRRHGHYNAKGYSETAKAIVDGVKKHKD